MRLLSALEQTAEVVWLAICAAALFIALGMAVHATALLVRRLRAVSFLANFRAWAVALLR